MIIRLVIEGDFDESLESTTGESREGLEEKFNIQRGAPLVT